MRCKSAHGSPSPWPSRAISEHTSRADTSVPSCTMAFSRTAFRRRMIMSWMMAYEDRTLVRTFARFFRSLHEATCCRGVSSQAGLRQMRASPALNRPRMHPGGRGSLCNPGKAAGPIVRAVGSGPYRHPTNGILLIHPPAQHAHRGTRNSRAKLEVAMARCCAHTGKGTKCENSTAPRAPPWHLHSTKAQHD